jgi:hypothetical protein
MRRLASIDVLVPLAAALLAGCATAPAPRAERWTAPPLGATWDITQRNTGSYGPDAQVRMTRTPDGTWKGQPALVFTNQRGGTLKLDPASGRWFALSAPNGEPVVSFEPALGWTFPIEVGQQWTTRHRMTMHTAGGRTVEYDLSCRVEAFEKVTVPAGTFDAFRIGCRTSIDNTETFWSSPDLGVFVKSSLRRGPANPQGPGTQDTELAAQTIRR